MASLEELRKRLPSLQGLSDEQAIRYLEQRYEVPAATIARNLGVKLPEPAAPPAPKRSLFAVANDTVIEAANAAAGTAGSIANFVSPGNRFSQGVDEFIREGEASQSDAVKADKARFRERMEGAQGFGDEVAAVGGYIADAPLQALAQAAGSIAVPGAAMKVAGALGGGVKTGLGIGAAIGGAGAGGDAAGTAYELAKEAGATDEEATAAARSASVIPGIVGAAGGVVGAERLLSGARGFGGNAASRALKTAGVEGAQEGIEEGITQYEGQRAAVPFDPTIDPMKGVAGAAAMGAALGGAAGGGVSLLSPAPAPPPDKKAEADAALTALGAAGSVDEAVALATKATDIPLLPAPSISVGPDGTAQTSAQRQAAAEAEAAARLERAGLRETGAQGQGRNSETAARDFSAWMAQTKAYPIQKAQEMAQIAQERGLRLEVVPHSSGMGFTLVPAAWLSDGQPRSVVSSRPNEGALPAAQIEALPTPDVLEVLEDIPAGDAAEVLPVGEAADVLPTGEVIEKPEALPTGEATDIEPEQADTELLLTGDGMPYGTRAGAYVRAKREGLPPEAVVEVPGGWAVKKESEGGPAQPDVPRTAGGTAAAAAGRAPDAVGGGVAVGRVAADARGGQPAPAAGAVAGVGEVRPAGDGGESDPALRVKALSAHWADAVARGDAAEARRLNDAIVEAKKPKEPSKPATTQSGYTLPDNVGDDWAATRAPGAKPTERQALVMAAVERALDDGVYYNRDMDERVAQELGVTPEMREPGKGKVEGGWFGHDVYLARKVVEARRERENETRLSKALSALKPGDSLGTLMFNDGKQVRGTNVEAIEGQSIVFTGKRGTVKVQGAVSPSQLKRAIERAHEREARKDGFDAFVAGLSKPGAAIDTLPEPVEETTQDEQVAPAEAPTDAAAPAPQAPPQGRAPEAAAPSASWVIRDKETGEVVMETFDRKKVDALNTAKYEAVPAREYLEGLNRAVKAKTAPEAKTAELPDSAAPAAQPVVAALGRDVMPEGLTVTFGGRTFKVDSLEDAQAKWIEFRDRAGAGVSEVGNGVVVEDGAGRMVGRISYNGRIFDPADNMVAEAPEAAPAPEPPKAATLPDTPPAAPTKLPAPPEQTRPQELIELRKRASVLKQLLRCLG